MYLNRDKFNCFVQSLPNTLLLPDAVQVNLPVSMMKNVSKGVCHHISTIATKLLQCYNLLCLTEHDSFSNKVMEIQLINLNVSHLFQLCGKLRETLLCTLADYVGNLFPGHYKFC